MFKHKFSLLIIQIYGKRDCPLLKKNETNVAVKLKGQLQGHTIIFKGLKMTFRTKILGKKIYTLISIKNATNFVSTTFL